MIAEEGMRVIRGKDWNMEDKDGGEGSVGTIVDISCDTVLKRALVIWDNGSQDYYEVEKPNKSEIIPIQQYRRIGNEFCCVRCHVNEGGIQWCCSICPDVILCTKCYMADFHDISHQFKRLSSSLDKWDPLPARSTSRKVMLKGLFQGATATTSYKLAGKKEKVLHGKVIRYLDNQSVQFCCVKVLWNDLSMNSIFYLGHNKKVEIKYTTAAKREYYYVDHMPYFSNENSLKKRTASVQGPRSFEKHFKTNQRQFLSLQPLCNFKDDNQRIYSNTKCNSFGKLKQVEVRHKRHIVQNEKALKSDHEDDNEFRSKLIKQREKKNETLQNGEKQLNISFKHIAASRTGSANASNLNLGKKIRQLEQPGESDVLKCCLCNKKDLNIQFQPCGHSMVCATCAKYFKKCFKCKGNIISNTDENEKRNNMIGNKTSNEGNSICKKEKQRVVIEQVAALKTRMEKIVNAFKCIICKLNIKSNSYICGHAVCNICYNSNTACPSCKLNAEVESKDARRKLNVFI